MFMCVSHWDFYGVQKPADLVIFGKLLNIIDFPVFSAYHQPLVYSGVTILFVYCFFFFFFRGAHHIPLPIPLANPPARVQVASSSPPFVHATEAKMRVLTKSSFSGFSRNDSQQ